MAKAKRAIKRKAVKADSKKEAKAQADLAEIQKDIQMRADGFKAELQLLIKKWDITVVPKLELNNIKNYGTDTKETKPKA